jgi:hypothetical protein
VPARTGSRRRRLWICRFDGGFAASYGGTKKVLYLEDIDNVPAEYKRHGFRQILKHHPFTRTEAIARVVAGKSLVALINVEAPVSGALRQHLPFYGQCADLAILHPTRAVPLENILGGAHIGLAPELPIAWSHWSNRAGEDLIDVALCHFYLRDLGSALRGWSYKPPTTKH